jgi:hypothetical protein
MRACFQIACWLYGAKYVHTQVAAGIIISSRYKIDFDFADSIACRYADVKIIINAVRRIIKYSACAILRVCVSGVAYPNHVIIPVWSDPSCVCRKRRHA